MRYNRRIFLIAYFLIFALASYSQTNSKKDYTDAKKFLFFKNYNEAIKPLTSILLTEPDNANINYLVGLCFLKSSLEKDKSISFLERAVTNTIKDYKEGNLKQEKAPVISYFYLGQAYHYTYEFNKAIESFNQYLNLLTSEQTKEKDLTELHINWCKNALDLIKDSAQIKITNQGKLINSRYDEHTPVLNTDESIMIFTSRREGSTGGLKTDDGRYFEDIYISEKIDENWTAPKNISENINTDGHEATIALSADGTELYIYKDDFGIGNIYVSTIDTNDVWSKPEKLGSNINSSSNETHVSVSADKRTLVFVSDRKGGFGGSDIYIVKMLPNGIWGLAQNIGEVINTPYDEDGVFIHPDGTSLFFSSKGHKSMGGFDLFFSELQSDGSWSEPVNLGSPINTTDDDIFYVLSADGKRAYYSTMKKDGFGGRDIYMMDLLSLPERSSVVIRGYVRIAGSDEIPKDISISITDFETGELMGIYKPNKKTGKYTLILRHGREYKITCEAKGCAFKDERINIPKHCSFFEINSPITLDPIGTIQKY
ncbi:MAG: hypothetical protein ABIJ97_00775 [Bacteroidota bacterium]